MKVSKYDISCFSYPQHPKKIVGSYSLVLILNNESTVYIQKIKTLEDAVSIILDNIKGYEFEVYPDLSIKKTSLAGEHIFTKYHELHPIN